MPSRPTAALPNSTLDYVFVEAAGNAIVIDDNGSDVIYLDEYSEVEIVP